MNIIRDSVTEKLSEFLIVSGQQLTQEVLKSIMEQKSFLVYRQLNHIIDDPSRIAATLQRVMHNIETICRRHNFARLLVLFRKMPHELTIDLLHLRKQTGEVDTFNFSPIYTEGLLFGTNCLLKFCDHCPSFTSNNDRYNFEPTEQELTDAVTLMLLSIIHRVEVFYMNSINRQPMASSVSLEQLLAGYNRRLKLRWAPKLASAVKDVLIYPILAVSFPREKRLWQCQDSTGKNYTVFMSNFLPAPFNSQKELERFTYLDTKDFSNKMGISFQTWCNVWLGLNKVVLQNIAVLWPDAWFKSGNPDFVHACLERADDYCETALGGGTHESIWKTCHTLLKQEQIDGCSTLEECRTVVERLTFKRFDGDVRFTEQPFVFYQVSPKLTFWDYLRHGGLLRCIARDLSRIPSATETKNKKGKLLENSVKTSIQQSVQGTSHFKLGTKIKVNGIEVWDIDVGFVCKGILFLIEAKNRDKKVSYYFDGVEVSDRILSFENFLKGQDEKLKKYKKQVKYKWHEVDNLSGAICVVCSVETEFIASFDKLFWLKLLDIPRICLLSEFIKFMENADVEELKKHPAYVSF